MFMESTLLFCIRVVIFIVIFFGDFDNVQLRYLIDKPYTNQQYETVPWVGILKFKDEETSQVWVCGVVLIASKVAIGNAGEISKIDPNTIRQSTKVMFPKSDGKWLYSGVINYTLHPEFNDVTLTTMAFLHLDYVEWEYEGEMLEWSQDYSRTYADSELFLVGFTDDEFKFEQFVRKMEYVEYSECIDFYVHEQLDSKWMRPTHYKCYKEKFSRSPCVFDAGMALVTIENEKWTLIGMSTWGPGCVLPARFITFATFAPWISSKIFTARRTFQTMDERYMYKLEKVAENQILMTSTNQNLEEQFGTCPPDLKEENIVYREEAKYMVPAYGLGWYTFSMYDENFFDDWFCVHITAGAQIIFKSPSKYWKTEGFGKKAGFDQRVLDFVRIVPILKPLETVNEDPKIVHLTNTWENYNHIDIRNFHFTFQFYKVGRIKIVCYGVRRETVPRVLGLSPPEPYRTHSYPDENVTYTPRTPRGKAKGKGKGKRRAAPQRQISKKELMSFWGGSLY